MANLLKYPGLNTKIKAMSSKLLTNKDLEELISESSVKDAIEFLQNRYSLTIKSTNRTGLEKEIYKLFVSDILKVKKYLNKDETELLNTFLLKYEIETIKNVFRRIETNKEIEVELKEIDIWTDNIFKDIKKINDVKTEEEFLESIKKNDIYKIFLLYKNELDEDSLEKVEVELDKYYFRKVYEISKNNKVMRDLIGREIDLLNIIWIYRMVKYFNYDEVHIEEILLPINYKLKEEDKKLLMNIKSFEEFLLILNKTEYKNIFKNEENIERDKNRYLYNINKEIIRDNLFNITFIISYFNLLDFQIKNIINIVEGIRYKIDKNELKNKLII